MDAQIDHFAKTLVAIKDKKEMKDFLLGILTPKERAELPMRLEIVKQLKKGVPQHVIAHKLGVGIATVTRGSKELSQGRFKNIKGNWQPSQTGG